MKMEKEDLKFFKNLLDDKLQELFSHVDSTVIDMTKPKENFSDPTDRATHDAERNFELHIRDREHKLIKKIEKALLRIENETFGLCEECKENISIKRLKARPITTMCIDCKTREEDMEKLLGI